MYDDFDDDMFDDGMEHHDHHGLNAAVAVGTGYALYRHGQDRQVAQIAALLDAHTALPEGPIEVIEVAQPVPVNIRPVLALDTWDDFIGQDALKAQLKVYIDSALKREDRMPHTLLASGFPGVGKTMLSRLIAHAMGVEMIELMPPFDTITLVEAACRLPDKGILFIDEIHKLADAGKRGAESLLKVLEEGVAFMPDGRMVRLPNVTIIGATTDRDKLPEPVIDRFKVKPHFQPYTLDELAKIAISFAARHDSLDELTNDDALIIGQACRGTPRIVEEMVIGQRDLMMSLGRHPDEEELLAFLDVTWDGLTPQHVNYLKFLYRYFGQQRGRDEVIFVAGEAAIKQMLRETTNGLQRIEAFLLERGFIDRTPRGRMLTLLGIERVLEMEDEDGQ